MIEEYVKMKKPQKKLINNFLELNSHIINKRIPKNSLRKENSLKRSIMKRIRMKEENNVETV